MLDQFGYLFVAPGQVALPEVLQDTVHPVELWRQSGWAFRMALLLAGVQFALTVVWVAATAQSATPGQLVFGLLGGLLFPAVIVVNLAIVARSRRAMVSDPYATSTRL